MKKLIWSGSICRRHYSVAYRMWLGAGNTPQVTDAEAVYLKDRTTGIIYRALVTGGDLAYEDSARPKGISGAERTIKDLDTGLLHLFGIDNGEFFFDADTVINATVPVILRERPIDYEVVVSGGDLALSSP